MERRRLGATGYEISVVGFGGWQIGGPGGGFAWPRKDADVSIAAIHTAIDAGINWIDTAPAYGFGRSEELVGEALKSMNDAPLVFTKCSQVWNAAGEQRSCLEPESLRAELQASIRRLAVEAIDLYQIHWPVPDEQLEAAWQTLVDFRDEGLVRAIGVSNCTVEQLQRLASIAPVQSLQQGYSLLNQSLEDELLPYCSANDVGVLAYSPLQSGLLGGTITQNRMASLPPDDWRHRDPMFQQPHLDEYLRVVDALRATGALRGVGVAEVALAWALRDIAVAGVIVGVSNPSQVAPLTQLPRLRRADHDRIEQAVAMHLVSPPPPPRFVPEPVILHDGFANG